MPDDDCEDRARCIVCGCLPGSNGGRWVGLNRWVVGTGTNKCYVTEYDCDGDDLWDPVDDTAAGPVACYPGCFCAMIEGKMAEVDFDLAREGGPDA